MYRLETTEFGSVKRGSTPLSPTNMELILEFIFLISFIISLVITILFCNSKYEKENKQDDFNIIFNNSKNIRNDK